ncbi:MAG TPA: diacylglycerol kinase family protein [Gaiellaceae bacterium]|nr:diacylglycerol kinase family protein [Gaiellaceae bacterium]
MPPFLLVNPRSGGGDVDRLVAAARRRGFAVHVLAEDDDPAELARDAPADVLAVAGGDGSLAGVAAVAAERSLPFGVVPFGTRNHFARDLGLDRRDPVAALGVVADGEPRLVDLGRANGRPFLNNVSLGAYAQLVHVREEHRRERNAFARLRALVLVARRRDEVAVTLDGDPLRSRVVLVANNAYDLDVLSLGGRGRLDEGVLHLYAPTGVVRANWIERRGTRFVVDAPHHRLHAAVDGEPDVLRTPVEFTIEPRALRVLAPREPRG